MPLLSITVALSLCPAAPLSAALVPLPVPLVQSLGDAGGGGGGGSTGGGADLGGGDSTGGGRNEGVNPGLKDNGVGPRPKGGGSDGIDPIGGPGGDSGQPPPPPPPPGGGTPPPPNPGSGGTPPPVGNPHPGAPLGPSAGTRPNIPITHSPFADLGYDPGDWSLWWRYNREPFLELKNHLYDTGTTTGSDELYLGHGELISKFEAHRPTRGQIQDDVVPALLDSLSIRNVGVRGGALMALARIGELGAKDGRTLVHHFTDSLRSGNMELEETATIALGILGDENAIPILTELMLDSKRGRQLVGGGEVPYRTRAFATYGLGLTAQAISSIPSRQLIAERLIDVLQGPKMSTQDLKVAAIAAFGLVVLPERPTVPRHSSGENTAHVLSRRAQVRYLSAWLEKTRTQTGPRHWRVRSHVPTALARLCVGMPDSVVEPVVEALLHIVRPNSKERDQLQQSCALALGDLVDCDAEGIDKLAREALIRLAKNGDRISRRFSLMSLGEIAGRPGTGENRWAGAKVCRQELMKTLSRGKTGLKPWAAMALGLMGHGELAAGGLPTSDVLYALRDVARRCARPGDVGAYALALGFVRDVDSEQMLTRKLRSFSDDNARGFLSLALGMIDARDTLQPIKEILRKSRRRPQLMASASIAAGLLGDKAIVEELLAMLGDAKSFSTQAAIATSLGLVGDGRAVEPLVKMLSNEELTDSARSFAAKALGMVCDKEPLPWNSKLSVGANYLSTTGSFAGTGRGVLDIL